MRLHGRKVAIFGVFTALALIFSYVELLIPINFGIPGAKLGLANLMTCSVQDGDKRGTGTFRDKDYFIGLHVRKSVWYSI